VLTYAVELDVLEPLDAPDFGAVLTEAAEAYRARAVLQSKRQNEKAARADNARAEKLEAQAKKLATTTVAKKPKPAGGETSRFEVNNTWTSAVTVIVDGVSYSVPAGETRRITVPAGAFTYEVRDIQAPVTRQVKAGETYAIRVEPR
jgi:sRNA-binding protein